ncbi:aromatic-L-amino-acid decarboxylase [Dictyobacter vulcani]|uniref:Aromatic-L-amino-acid decarboxylase n=1 Tax=Dictyobacter vulcani TaxID=2607529 RepID=A0A5J4KPT0_9CHLR|nr:pyridoxal-dependent decarboxylase [Dictyobacter vulcani]GER89192.1 aromatic-L-amino-acid decarboxylase [Dictyobacter vulcani]
MEEPSGGEYRQPGDMDADSLRRYGHQVVDWMVDYLNGAQNNPILAQVTPGEISYSVGNRPPVQPEAMDTILADLESLIMPGITHWNSAGFMGYFGISGSGPSILAEMFDATLNVTRMLWRTAPAATELEQVVLIWLREMLGLPETMFGMLYPNSAIVHALVAAREAIPRGFIACSGLAGRADLPPLCLYTSQEAHVSIDKAAVVLGIGLEGVRKIRTDAAFRMDTEDLKRIIQEDLRAGFLPFAVVATVGTTSTTSIDPVAAIADICKQYGLWLHVDAAYAGAAALVPEKRWILAGCERADSFSVNPHKWLFTTFSCSAFFTRHPEMLKSALGVTSDYLANGEGDNQAMPDLMDYDFSLPHRFPALKLWMVIRYFGQEGLAKRIAEHCRLATLLAEWIAASADFECMAPVPLSVVCLRAHPLGIDQDSKLDTLNERIVQRVNASGNFFLSHTRIHGKYTIRVAISHIRTQEIQVRGIWAALQGSLQVELGMLRRQKMGHSALHMLNLPTRSLL